MDRLTARDPAFVRQLRTALRGQVREDEELARYSTYRIGGTATVVLPTVVENGSHRVRWTRRTVDQHYPLRSEATDAAVRDAVVSWAQSRQACAPPTNEYANGILGVVGLADALCRTTGIAAIGEVGDLDALDEPDPIIEGFGGSALSWARVVTLDGPVPMRVVAAPVGDGWTVIALARTSLISP